MGQVSEEKPQQNTPYIHKDNRYHTPAAPPEPAFDVGDWVRQNHAEYPNLNVAVGVVRFRYFANGLYWYYLVEFPSMFHGWLKDRNDFTNYSEKSYKLVKKNPLPAQLKKMKKGQAKAAKRKTNEASK